MAYRYQHPESPLTPAWNPGSVSTTSTLPSPVVTKVIRKTTETEEYDEKGNLVKRVTVIEEEETSTQKSTPPYTINY